MIDWSKVQAVTFDAAGTLIRPHPSVGEVYCEVLEEAGHSCQPKEIETQFGLAFKAIKAEGNRLLNKPTWREIVGLTLKQIPPEELDLIFETLWQTFAEARRWQILPHTENTLEQLKNRGYRLAVLSNNDSRLHSVLEGLNLNAYFEHVLVSTELGYEKPHPEVFAHTEQKLKLAATQLLHVGDSPKEDQAGAESAGWQSYLIKNSIAEIIRR